MLDVSSGKIVSPCEVLVQDERIVEVGAKANHPAGAQVIDLGDVTLMPGLIDAHVHLFLHPGAEDLQTVEESVPKRTILATLAAKADLMAGFTAERDMGTEGAGWADSPCATPSTTASFPGRACASAATPSTSSGATRTPTASILNSTYSPTPTAPTLRAARRSHSRAVKQGADFTKIYETGRDQIVDGTLHTPYQYTEAQLAAAVAEAARTGSRVAVHAPVNPARYTRFKRASSPSIMPTSSATRPWS